MHPYSNKGPNNKGPLSLTKSSISLVWEAERHILTLDSTMEVAGNPTTTTPIFLRSISRENALQTKDSTGVSTGTFL